MAENIEALVKPLVDCEPEVIASPWHIFDAIIDHDPPIVYSDSLEAWIVAGRRHVMEILADSRTWSNRSVGSSQKANEHFFRLMRELRQDPETAPLVEEFTNVRRNGTVLILTDPPTHLRHRRAFAELFRPKRIQSMTDEIQEISDDLVGRLRPLGRADWIADYAVQMPITILARNFGVPEQDGPKFKEWSNVLASRIGRIHLTKDDILELILKEKEFREYFSPLLEARAWDPQDDLISDIATAAVDGEPLTDAEKLEACQQFVIAGHETTTSNIANIGRRIAADPALREQLAGDRSLIPGFVEEVLRLDPPVLGFFRMATKDTEVAGEMISEGEYVWVAYAGGNRDPAGCPMSHEFDMTRHPNQHLSFGYGEHACLGANLARVQSIIATNALIDLPNLALAPDHVDAYSDSYILRGLRSLKITFDASPDRMGEQQ
jgi:cytochrome P450